MTNDEQIALLKERHDRLQEGLPSNKMAIREGIILDVGEGEYDSYPRYGFQFFCWRSPEMVKEMDLFIKYAKEVDFKCFLDIGAYHGIFSLVIEALGWSKTSAFEPSSDPFCVLSKVAYGKNIRCIPFGLSDSVGNIDVEDENGHAVISTNQTGRTIPVITGDLFCYLSEFNPTIIKIDCEGHELNVLRGFSNTLRSRPLIFLELHFSRLSNDEVIEIVSIIDNNKYFVIDTETDSLIESNLLLGYKQGEKRVILK